MKNIQLDNISFINNESLMELFLFLFKKNNVNHADLFKNVKLTLFPKENIGKIKKIVNSENFTNKK